MVVAVTIAGVMEVAIHDVVDVIAVRDRRVLARGPVPVFGRVTAACVRRSAQCRVGIVHLERVRLDRTGVNVLESAVPQIVLVVTVPDRRMLAAGAVRMQLALVSFVSAHGRSSSSARWSRGAALGRLGWGLLQDRFQGWRVSGREAES
jgi:hypothetical protein